MPWWICAWTVQRVVGAPAVAAPTSPRARTAPASAPRTCCRPSDGHELRCRCTGRRPRRRRRRSSVRVTPTGLVSCQRPVARVRERAPAPVVLLLRQLPAADADVVDDAALADDGVVAAGRRGGVVGPEVEQHAVDARAGSRSRSPSRRRARRRAGAAAGTLFCDDLQADRQPAVVDGREDRVEVRVVLGRPVGELLARAVVVPVVVLARVARSAPCARASSASARAAATSSRFDDDARAARAATALHM